MIGIMYGACECDYNFLIEWTNERIVFTDEQNRNTTSGGLAKQCIKGKPVAAIDEALGQELVSRVIV